MSMVGPTPPSVWYLQQQILKLVIVWLGICIIRIRQKRSDKKSTDSTLPLLLIIVTISDNEVAIIIILAIVIRVFQHILS